MKPLPLVPFERYMIHDDRPEWPMTFVARMRLRGRVQGDVFAAAAEEALGRQPLLRARLRTWGRSMHWVVQPPGPAMIEMPAEAEAILPERSFALDPRREDGVRLVVLRRADSTEVLAAFHHAATDGIGAYKFLGDVLACYGRRVGGPRLPTLGPCDPELLRRRYPFRIDVPNPLPPLAGAAFFVREGMKLFGEAAEPLAWGAPPGTAEAGWSPAQVALRLSAAESRALRLAAEMQGATVNDLLLRDLFLTLAAWNAAHGRDPAAKNLRITMPTDMRRRDDGALPAANVIGYAFLTVPGAACADPVELLAELRRITARIRARDLGRMFVDGVALADLVPGMLGMATAGLRRMSTAILSNLGEVTRRFTAKFPFRDGEPLAGDVTLAELTGAPPLRPGTTAAFLVTSLAGRTTLSLQVSPRLTTRLQAEKLLGLWRRSLMGSAGVADPTLPVIQAERPATSALDLDGKCTRPPQEEPPA